MNECLNIISLICLLVAGIAVGGGFELRQWKSWLYILCGFLFGFIQLRGIVGGMIIAVLMIWGGPIAFKQRH